MNLYSVNNVCICAETAEAACRLYVRYELSLFSKRELLEIYAREENRLLLVIPALGSLSTPCVLTWNHAARQTIAFQPDWLD